MPGYPQGKSFDMGPIQWGEGGVAGPGAYIYNIYIYMNFCPVTEKIKLIWPKPATSSLNIEPLMAITWPTDHYLPTHQVVFNLA